MTRRRRALGPRDVNIFAPHPALLGQYDSDTNTEISRKANEGVSKKRPLELSDDGQTAKAMCYFGAPDKRVGIGHWLENGTAEGGPSCLPGHGAGAVSQFDIQDDAHLAYTSQEGLLSFVGESDFNGVSRERPGASTFAGEGVLEPSRALDKSVPSASSHFSTSVAATTLRLRLRVALFKVQTNQTAIPISHLQLPEFSPQPLSVFPPSLVRVTAANNAQGGYYNGYGEDELDSTVSPPPSSPPPTQPTGGYNNRGIPFLTPIRSSSPSPNHGKPLDFGSSSDSQENSSRGCSPAPH